MSGEIPNMYRTSTEGIAGKYRRYSEAILWLMYGKIGGEYERN
jgi:hypothetical protein